MSKGIAKEALIILLLCRNKGNVPTNHRDKNYTIMNAEENIIAKFKAALADGDVQTLQYMLSFTERFEQMARNIKTYEQYLACGFTGKPSFDKYGWIDNEKELEDSKESVPIFREDRAELIIELCQLPNGKWVSGIFLTLSESGHCGGASIWGNQHPDRLSAYMESLKKALSFVQHSSCKYDMKYIKIIKQEIAAALQPCLF